MEYIKEDLLGIDKNGILSSRGIELISFSSVDSTQAAARRHVLAGGCAPALFVADTQTGGRGRLGRSFYSPADTGVYMTLLLDVTEDAQADVAHITSAVAVAVAATAEKYAKVRCQIKWVNDILINGRKVCGILAESFFANGRRYVGIGVGVNLSTSFFPEDISALACSLCPSGSAPDRGELTLALNAGIYDIYQKVRSGDTSYMSEYKSRSAVLGRQVTFIRNGASYDGLAVDIDENGGLVIAVDGNETVTLTGGEISLRIKDTEKNNE